jgi:hypothetical protein
MKKSLFISITFTQLFILTSVFSKPIDPYYCADIPPQKFGWNEKEAKATFTGLPRDYCKIWFAFVLDDSWENWSEIPLANVPGQTTYTTPTIIPKGEYWNPTFEQYVGGAASNSKPGFVFLNLWSPSADPPRNGDCNIKIKPSEYICPNDTGCTLSVSYCENISTCVSMNGKYVQISGLNADRQSDYKVLYSDDGWASYAPVKLTFSSQGQTELCTDLSQLKYVSGPKMGSTIETPLTGSISIVIPGLCSADSGDGNVKKGIDLTQVSKCMTCEPSDVNQVEVHSTKVSPNPAFSHDVITIQGQFSTDVLLSITGVNGIEIAKMVPRVEPNGISVSLSSLDLHQGIYLLRIITKEREMVTKLMIK